MFKETKPSLLLTYKNKSNMKYLFLFALLGLLTSCNSEEQKEQQTEQQPAPQTLGSIEKADPALDAIVSADAKAEIIAEGFDWSEGPLWIEKTKTLLFSDVPKNTIYKWTEGKGKEVYLTPSGYTDTVKRGGETGSNGLLLDNNGNLVLCQHGNRQMARMNSPVDDPKPEFVTIAGKYKGKRFSSPNDGVYSSSGELYFTDPPYGLDKPSSKETPVNGVYKVKKNGEVILLVDSITRPNGIALFPGEKRLLVASSDGSKPNWYVFDVEAEGVKNGRIFYSAAGRDTSWKGLPDGFKIDKNGNVYASGPGGIYFFNSEGKVLGKLKLADPASNVALSPDEKTLYITNDMYVLRLKMRE
jgi:gluconolactonase